MAEIILSPIIKGAVSKAISFANEQICLAWGFEKEMRSLKELLKMIQDVLLDAENKQEGDPAVRRWLQNLKDVAYDAVDVLDEYAYELLQLEVETQGHKQKQVCIFLSCFDAILSCFNAIVFRLKMANKIKKINETLVKIKEDAVFPLLSRSKGETLHVSQSPTDSFLDANPIGRSDDVSKIISQLSKLRSQHSISVVSIVGMAGIGKTTLAKSVFKEVNKRLYDVAAWFCVSDHFDDKAILGGMLESLDKTAGGITNIDAILRHLENELSKKTFLLVLDDVWNEDPNKWDAFSNRLFKIVKTTGNSIIVTTRSNRVASAMEALPVHQHELKGLSDDECWSIIKEKVHGCPRRPIDSNLEAIGRDIARKCKGLPLVANVLGGTMGSEIGVEQWSTIKNNDAWMNLEDNQKKILKISFDHLSGPLKKCFAFCSIFEKDTTMEKDELVQLWMAEGFLLPPNGSNLTREEDVGDRYFDYLLSNSLFQDIERNEIGDVKSCKMHDAVHDLAVFVSGGESLIWDQTGSIDENSKVRHLRLKSNGEALSRGVSQKLHSLFLEADCDCNLSASNIKSLRSLNLVSDRMKRCTEEDLPISLSNLKHLRYLDISSSEIIALPKSFSKLYNLQTLKLMWCSDLEKVPDNMRNLVSLRHLYFNDEKHMPKEIGHLTSLQTLSTFVVGVEKGYKIEELGRLIHLRGKLKIRKLEHVGSKLEASKAELNEKKKLQQLTLRWSEETEANNSINAEEVLEGLQPHSNLQSLVIKNYQGKNFTSWMQAGVNSSLNNLLKLELCNCNECLCLPSFGLLPKLQFLRIDGMNNVKSMGSKFYVDQSNSNDGVGSATQFPALREFSVKEMKSLEEWVEVEGMTVFPCLEQLSIEDCSELKTWSMAGFSSNHKLSSLRISSCPKLMAIPSMDGLLSLRDLTIHACDELMSLPSGLGSCISLQELYISHCGKLSSIPCINGLTSLTKLRLSNCDELMSLPSGLGSCISLQELDIFRCRKLSSIPCINGLTSLTMLQLSHCDELMSLPSGLGSCISLQELYISHCSKLSSIPCINGLTSLTRLGLSNCDELMSLPSGLGSCISLQELDISRCRKLSSIPCINGLTSLTMLELSHCDELMSLPSGLGSCISLQELDISYCGKLSSIPCINGLTSLTMLKLSHCDELMSLPSGLGSCISLQTLDISRCRKLSSIPCINGLTSLTILELSHCDELMSLPSGLGSCISLQQLDISHCRKLSSIPCINGLTSLAKLQLFGCHELMSLPSGLESCIFLQELDVYDCHKLSSIPCINGLTSLKTLQLSSCYELMGLPIGLGSCSSLRWLSIFNCHNIISITEEIGELHSLRSLAIWYCGELRSIPEECLGRLTCLKRLLIGGFWSELEEFPGLTSIHQLHASLEELELYGWDKLKSLPHQLQHLTALKELELCNFDSLEALPEWLADLSSLHTLKIRYCSNLTHLPSIEAIGRLSNLQYLEIRYCPKLEERYAKESRPEWAMISHIRIKINGYYLQ